MRQIVFEDLLPPRLPRLMVVRIPQINLHAKHLAIKVQAQGMHVASNVQTSLSLMLHKGQSKWLCKRKGKFQFPVHSGILWNPRACIPPPNALCQ